MSGHGVRAGESADRAAARRPHHADDWGDPLYPTYAEPVTTEAPPSTITDHRRLCIAAGLVALAAFGGAAYALVTAGDRLSSADGLIAAPSGAGGPAPSDTATHAAPLPLPPFPTGANLASSNPCSYGTGPQQVAMIYLGLAAVGQTDSAQSCVYRRLVPSVTTRSLATDGARYLPDGEQETVPSRPAPTPGGTAYLFRRSDGSGRVGVTVTREPDGRHWITNVRVG